MKTVARHQAAEPQGATRCRPSPSPATPTPASPRCSTVSPAPASSSRTRCSRRSTRPSAGPRPRTAGRTRSPTPSASSGPCRTQLVEAFRSTLEEVADADLLAARRRRLAPRPGGPDLRRPRGPRRHRRRRLREIIVVNKADAGRPRGLDRLQPARAAPIVVSARTGLGLDALSDLSRRRCPARTSRSRSFIPYDRGDLVSRLHEESEVLSHRAPRGRDVRARQGAPAAAAASSRPTSSERFVVPRAGNPSGPEHEPAEAGAKYAA